jgi:hypothetical protein
LAISKSEKSKEARSEIELPKKKPATADVGKLETPRKLTKELESEELETPRTVAPTSLNAEEPDIPHKFNHSDDP